MKPTEPPAPSPPQPAPSPPQPAQPAQPAQPPAAKPLPQTVPIETLDVLRVLLLNERRARLDAELALLRNEEQANHDALLKKYAIDPALYVLNATGERGEFVLKAPREVKAPAAAPAPAEPSK